MSQVNLIFQGLLKEAKIMCAATFYLGLEQYLQGYVKGTVWSMQAISYAS